MNIRTRIAAISGALLSVFLLGASTSADTAAQALAVDASGIPTVHTPEDISVGELKELARTQAPEEVEAIMNGSHAIGFRDVNGMITAAARYEVFAPTESWLPTDLQPAS